jgi:hypothetical protein
MNRDESHRQGRGFGPLQEHHLRQSLEFELQALQGRVVIDRSFVNCPRLRHSSKFSFLNFQGLTSGKVIALSPVRGFQTRPDVKNPERSERTSRPENQRSIGSCELKRIETANPVRRSGPADSLGIARSNAGGSRGCEVFGTMRFQQHRAPKLRLIHS